MTRLIVSLRRVGALALLLAITGSPSVAQSTLTDQDRATIRLNISDLLVNEMDLPLPVRQRRDALAAYYEEQGGVLVWMGSDRAPALIQSLRSAADDGLDPADYPANQLDKLSQAVSATDSRGRAIIELHFSAAFLEYASDLQVGRFLPRKVDPNFFLQKREIDQVAALQELAGASNLEDFLISWQPAGPDYAALRVVLADYRALARAGGWPKVLMGETLKPEMSDPRVPDLRARLAVTDGAAPQPPSPDQAEVYTDDLVPIVKAFQARHGLEVDGLAGRATIVALNVPVEDRIQDIVVAMERWRWMPSDLGDEHLMVNIAGFDLTRVRDGRVQEKMAVVVGKPYHRTPVFSDEVKYLEFNPYWNVPISIAVKEELPKLRKNPAARAAAGFEAVRDGKVYNLTSINWRRYGPGNFPFQLRQRPGPHNALGRVKYMFPNEFNVYLHDTPSRSLFSRAERAFSHGCVRLSKPLELAPPVLADGGLAGWDLPRVNQVVQSGKRTVVNLEKPLPVHITYFTAWVYQGLPNFRADIYEQDKKLIAALGGQSIAW
ncbi:MAG: L,D-transpeptidase family protein [Hyphomicrobiales bacterium]|nr:L,D-transpeptidase family protein [Hyphomicrobiales bacterium]